MYVCMYMRIVFDVLQANIILMRRGFYGANTARVLHYHLKM